MIIKEWWKKVPWFAVLKSVWTWAMGSAFVTGYLAKLVGLPPLAIGLLGVIAFGFMAVAIYFGQLAYQDRKKAFRPNFKCDKETLLTISRAAALVQAEALGEKRISSAGIEAHHLLTQSVSIFIDSAFSAHFQNFLLTSQVAMRTHERLNRTTDKDWDERSKLISSQQSLGESLEQFYVPFKVAIDDDFHRYT